MSLGETAAAAPENVDGQHMDATGGGATRTVPLDNRVRSKVYSIIQSHLTDGKVFYTADEIKSFRTLGLEPGASGIPPLSRNLTHVPGLKLLGFKNYKELVFEDNIKHSVFINPDEMVGTYAYTFASFDYSGLGTRRTPGANAPSMRF